MNEITQGLNIPTGEAIELVALAVKTAAIRCKIVSTDQPIIFRKIRNEVECEILK